MKHTAEILGLVSASIGIISLFIPKWREFVARRMQQLLSFCMRWMNHELYASQSRILELLEVGAPRWNEAAAIGKENAEGIADLKRIVTNGLSHSVLRLVARDRTEFEAKTTPAFVCDDDGHNYLVSSGYRTLIGVDREMLTGHGWESVIYGPLKDQYIATFRRCVETGEDFTATVDFQHPLTGEHRGRWRIYAPCEKIGEHLMFSGRPVLAEDHTAASIVCTNSWPIAVSPLVEPEPVYHA